MYSMPSYYIAHNPTCCFHIIISSLHPTNTSNCAGNS